MRTTGIVAIIAALLLSASPERAQAVQRLIDVRQVPTDTLRDVAVATYEHGRPVIYYNPSLLQQFGPQMTAFFFAHEYGHIRYGHAGAALLSPGELSELRQRQELEADCYAALSLGPDQPEAVNAALRFFTRMGPFRFDALHPTGSQRAAKILSCLPVEGPTTPSSADEAPDGIRVPASVTLRAPARRTRGYGYDARIWIDETPVAIISSLRQPGSVALSHVTPGAHRYRLSLQVYSFDTLLQLNPSGTVAGGGDLTVRDGDVFQVEWNEGAAPTLVRH